MAPTEAVSPDPVVVPFVTGNGVSGDTPLGGGIVWLVPVAVAFTSAADEVAVAGHNVTVPG